MTPYFVNKREPHLGSYQISRGVEGFRWHWVETAKGIRYEEHGDWFLTLSDAFRDAADDWESTGDSGNKRLSGQLRAAATRAESTTA